MKKKLWYALLFITSVAFSQIPNPVQNGLARSYEFVNASLSDSKNGQGLVAGTQSAVSFVNNRFGIANDAVTFSNYPNANYFQLSAPGVDVTHPKKMSYSFWIKTSTNDGTYRAIVHNGNTQVYLRNGKIGAWISGYHQASGQPRTTVTRKKLSTRNIDDGNWHHIVVNLEAVIPGGASNYKYLILKYNFYIDGVHEPEQAHTTRFYVGNSPFGAGMNNAGTLQVGRNFEDEIDDLYIYNQKILDQTEVNSLSNPIVNIPDNNFKQELAGLVDNNFDGEIQLSEASTYTGVINVSGRMIGDLTGIEAFRKVTTLDCSNNSLTALDLSKNTALTTVNASGNQIAGDVDFSKNGALTSLNISGNSIVTLNMANANNYSITNFDATANTSLACISTDAGFTPTSIWLKDNTADYSDDCFPTLVTSVIGDGSITISPTSPNGVYTYGTVLTLTPVPATASHQFTGWSGDETGIANPLTITINTDTDIDANFSFTPTILRVDANVSGGNNDGSSWANAFSSIQDAVNAAGSYGDEIWIAKGIYTPHATNNTIAFTFNKNFLKIYGGFAGTEALLSDRDMSKIHTHNATILSGDLNNDDIRAAFANANRTDNSLKVVRINNNNIVLDGLTVSDGHGDLTATSGVNRYGSGVYKIPSVENLTIKNCIIKSNVAQFSAGVSFEIDATQHRNTNYVIDKCIFKDNLAPYAAAFMVWANRGYIITNTISITNSLFDNNKTVDYLSLTGRGGSSGWIRTGYSSASHVTNATIVNNTFVNGLNNGTGGGEYPTLVVSKTSQATLNATISNNIFWGNQTNGSPSKAIGKGTDPVIVSASSVSNSIDEDNFSNLTGTVNTTNINPNLDANFKLQATSLSAINAGDNTKIPSGIATDLAGNTRFYNVIVDLGAYEFTSGPITVTTWTGANTTWASAINWSNGVPTNMLDAYIPNGLSSYPTIASTAQAKDIIIENLANTTIAPNGNLSAENITTNDNLTIQSNATNSGSLMATTVTGNVSYERYVTDKWHLIGAPVEGQDIASFVTSSSLATGTANPNNRGLGIYDNTQTTPWVYYQTTASWGNFEKGKGYTIKHTTAGEVNFTGTVNTGNVQFTGTGSASNTFEMVSNPYTAYVDLNSGTNDFLTANLANIKSTNVAAYFWNDTTGSYDVVNNSSFTTHYLTPGQGFFVQMANTGGTIDFAPTMLSHQTSGVLARTAQQTVVKLSISEGKTRKTTQIKYLANTNNGLDVGYDAGYFDANQSKIGVYTKLVDGSYTDTNFMLQCVNNAKAEETVIPLGIKTDAEREVTFSAEAMNLPSNLNVYLEDTQTGEVTQLNNGGIYKATVTAGVGRFYLHTKETARLSNTNVALNNIAVYKNNNNSLVIKGLQEEATVKMYSMLGKEVLSTGVSKSNTSIALPSLATGVYLINIKTENEQVSKKIILE